MNVYLFTEKCPKFIVIVQISDHHGKSCRNIFQVKNFFFAKKKCIIYIITFINNNYCRSKFIAVLKNLEKFTQ